MIVSGMECTIACSKGAVDEAVHGTVQREGCFPPFLELWMCLRTTFRQDFTRQGPWLHTFNRSSQTLSGAVTI